MKSLGVLLIVIATLLALGVSYWVSKMHFISWWHEIALCGTDKVAMSITALSVANRIDYCAVVHQRQWWMGPFETYFGIVIKFVNPACLCFFIFEAAAADMEQTYGITSGYMTSFASIYVVIALFIIFMPMMMCDHKEDFGKYDPVPEFAADEIHEVADRNNEGAKDGEELKEHIN